MSKLLEYSQMFIYYLLLLIVVCCIIAENNKSTHQTLIFLCVITFCIAGFRNYSIGSDTSSYIQEFMSGDYFIRDVDQGFSYFNEGLNALGFSPRLYLIVVSLIIILPVFAFISRYSKGNNSFTVLLYLTIGNFTFNLAGMRQSIAIAIILIGLIFYDAINHKVLKNLVLLLLIILASTFHNTAKVCILLIPLIWLSHKSFSKRYKSVKVLLIVFPVIIMFATKFIANVVSYFMIQKYSYYETTFGDSNIISYIVIPYCIYLYSLFLFYQTKTTSWKNNFCFYCSIAYMCIASCTLYMPMLGRFEYYFSMPLMCLISNLTMDQPLSTRRNLLLVISLLCISFFLISTPGGTLKIDHYSFF